MSHPAGMGMRRTVPVARHPNEASIVPAVVAGDAKLFCCSRHFNLFGERFGGCYAGSAIDVMMSNETKCLGTDGAGKNAACFEARHQFGGGEFTGQLKDYDVGFDGVWINGDAFAVPERFGEQARIGVIRMQT